MNEVRQELITFRLKRSEDEFTVALLSAEKEVWNTAASRLYYTCYYLTIALFAKYDIKTSTHSGVRNVLGSHFILQGVLDEKWGRLLSKLFSMRQEGDYRDFKIFTKEEIMPLIQEVEEFRKNVFDLLEQAGYKTNNES